MGILVEGPVAGGEGEEDEHDGECAARDGSSRHGRLSHRRHWSHAASRPTCPTHGTARDLPPGSPAAGWRISAEGLVHPFVVCRRLGETPPQGRPSFVRLRQHRPGALRARKRSPSSTAARITASTRLVARHIGGIRGQHGGIALYRVPRLLREAACRQRATH